MRNPTLNQTLTLALPYPTLPYPTQTLTPTLPMTLIRPITRASGNMHNHNPYCITILVITRASGNSNS